MLNDWQPFWDGRTERERENIFTTLDQMCTALRTRGDTVDFCNSIHGNPRSMETIVGMLYQQAYEAVVKEHTEQGKPLPGSAGFMQLSEAERNKRLRIDYYNSINAKIPDLVNGLGSSATQEEKARIACAMRTCAMVETRGMMTSVVDVCRIMAREIALYGSPVGATYDHLKSHGKTDVELVDSASRTNASVTAAVEQKTPAAKI